MTQQPPRPPLPNLSGYRPSDERRAAPAGQPAQRLEPQFGRPAQLPTAAAPRTARGPVRRRRSWLRIAAWTIGGLGLVTTAGATALVLLTPVGLIREQIIREVQVRTGRDLVVSGKTSLSVLPSLALTMGDVSLSAPPAMGGAPFVRMRRLEVRVALMPLLSRRVSVEQLVLSDPVFELRVDQRGRRSWEFAALAGTPTILVAQAPARQGQGQGGSPPIPSELQEFLRNSSQGEPAAGAAPHSAGRRISVPDIALGDVRIDNGTVHYRDERIGLTEQVRAINVRLSARSLTSPFEARGDLALRGEKVDFDGRIGSPKALLEERPTRVALSVVSARVSGRYEGSLTVARSNHLDGALKIDSRSLRGLADWIGAGLRPGLGLGPFMLEGELKSGPTSVALTNARLKLDELAGSGNITVDLAGVRPSVRGDLRLGAVDLNPYLAPREAGATGSAAGGQVPVAAPGSAAGPATGPQVPGPQVRGFTGRTGWSEAQFDLAPLGLVDAQVRLSLASLAYRDVKLGAVQAGIGLKSRHLRATLDDVRLYGGQGRGVVAVEPGGLASAVVTVNLTLDGIAGLPLLRDATGFDWIDGKGRIQLAVGGSGAHERAIMESLSGKAELGFTDGAIVGFNIPQMIRGIGQGRVPAFNRVATERTEFSEAGASFQIRNGVAETKDMRATSPMLRLTGAGTANIGQRQIDATLRPRLVSTQSGPSSPGDLAGLDLPVRIRGAWERPTISPDIDGLLKNPGQAGDTIRELGKQIQQGKGGAAINNLLERFIRK